MWRKLVLITFLALALVCSLSSAFHIETAEASGTIYIRATGQVEGTDKIEWDGDVYTFIDDIYDEIVVERDNIVVNGACYTLQGTGSGTGIFLSGRSNVTIKNMEIKDFYHGIHLFESSDNAVSGNNISNNFFGVWPHYSSNNTISGNNISNNECGIWLHWASNISISGNNIAGSSIHGIWHEFSSNNTIYHNNLINNTNQVGLYSSFNTTWNNGCEGNYWSNYTGVDSDHDGIGDSWHEIDEHNTDHYPLMGMFSDFYATSEWNIQTICNSSISGFGFNGTAFTFNVSGMNDTNGFCRLCIPKALMNETYKVFVNGTEVPHALLLCSNSTHNYLYFAYNHSTQEIVIVPEFPSFLILPLFMVATLLVIIVYRRRLS